MHRRTFRVVLAALCVPLLALDSAHGQAPPAAPEKSQSEPAPAASPAPKEAPAAEAAPSDANQPPVGAPEDRPKAAWTPPPEWRLVMNSATFFRWNPLGLQTELRFGVQKRLFHRDNSAVLRDNFIHIGIYPRLNPAFVKIGPSVEIQPLSVLNLRFAAEWMGYFRTFGFLQSFLSPLEDFADSTQFKNRQKEVTLPNGTTTTGSEYQTSGMHVMIEPTLQFRFDVGKNADGTPKHGSIAIRNKLSIEYWNMRTRASNVNDPSRLDAVFYEATLDTLVPRDGWVISNDLDLIFITKFRFVAGVRYSVVAPQYKLADFRSEDEFKMYAGQNTHHRLGPLLGYTFFDKGYARFTRPTVLLIANWYLSHRFRTGQDVSQAIPYLVVGFQFASDLLQ